MTKRKPYIDPTLLPTWALNQFNIEHANESFYKEAGKAKPDLKRIEYLQKSFHTHHSVYKTNSSKWFS